MMSARRWQDWAALLIGAVLVVAPFVFATGLAAPEAVAAYFFGGLVILGALINLAFPAVRYGEAIQIVLAVVIFVTPWALGFTAVAGMAWVGWILAVLLAATATTVVPPERRLYPART